jgi:hypothetical protein
MRSTRERANGQYSGVFQKHKDKRAAQQAAREADQAARNEAEKQRIADAWRDYFELCEQRIALARTFDGVTGAEANGCPIALKKDERMFFAVVSGAVLVEPRRSGGHWQGGSQGVSVRVPGTKSMRYRVGSTRGSYVQGEETPTPVDEGSFTITNQRSVFVGTKASREWQWSKMLGVTHASDAPWTAIAVSNRQKVSGVACDAANIDTVRFWIDLAIANASGTRDELVNELETHLEEQRQIANPTSQATALRAQAPEHELTSGEDKVPPANAALSRPILMRALEDAGFGIERATRAMGSR